MCCGRVAQAHMEVLLWKWGLGSSFRHYVFVIGRPPSWVLKKHEKSAGIKYLFGSASTHGGNARPSMSGVDPLN
jgi:hypothetical protein